MYARRDIVSRGSILHVTSRCHNREFLFKPNEVKEHIILTWAKYCNHYRIKFFDFNVMDNHFHIVVKAPSAVELGHFMRTTNAEIARYVNRFHKRDSHALKERYKSPVITSAKYLIGCLQYIWTNRYKIDGSSDPKVDPYCSLSWTMHPELMKRVFGKYKEFESLLNLLTPRSELPCPVPTEYRELLEMLNDAKNKIASFIRSIYQHAHTIGDALTVEFRGRLLSATRKDYVPWVPI